MEKAVKILSIDKAYPPMHTPCYIIQIFVHVLLHHKRIAKTDIVIDILSIARKLIHKQCYNSNIQNFKVLM